MKTQPPYTQISSHFILRSNNDFIFKVPHPDLRDNDRLTHDQLRLFTELKALDFIHFKEVVIFKTVDNRIGFAGEEFTSWYPEKSPRLSITLLNSAMPDKIHLLNMKPAKGEGFCTISFPPDLKEFIIFFFNGSDGDWNDNFKKTDKLMQEITAYLGCSEIKTSTAYNC